MDSERMSGFPFDNASFNHSALVWSGVSFDYTCGGCERGYALRGCVFVVRGGWWSLQLFFSCLPVACVCPW
jgi:hypothetical protein